MYSIDLLLGVYLKLILHGLTVTLILTHIRLMHKVGGFLEHELRKCENKGIFMYTAA